MKTVTVVNTDIVQTPGPSAQSQQKTSVPGLVIAPAPETIKKPITLDQAIQIAFQSSPDIISALALLESSKGGIDASTANFKPVFRLQASSTLQGPENTAVKTSSSLAGLTATLPLDISRQLRYSSEITHMQYQLQYLSMLTVSEQLILKVKNAYYTLLRSSGQEIVRKAAVSDAKLRLANILAKREEGTVPQFDVTSIQVELSNLNQLLLSAQNQVRLAQSALNEVLGVDVNNPTQVISAEVPVTVSDVEIPKLTAEAYSKRPDVKSAQIAVALSEKNVDLQKVGLLPSASLNGTTSYSFNPSVMATDNYTWQATVTLSIPLSDGGMTKAKVRQAKASVQSSMSSLNRTLLSVSSEVRSISLNLQDAALRTKTTEAAIGLAEDALGIAKERYDAGIAVMVEVSNAQSQLTQARFNYVNALFDYAVATAQLQKATSSQPEMMNLQLLSDQNANSPYDKEPRK